MAEKQQKTFGDLLSPDTLDGQMALLQIGQSMMAPRSISVSPTGHVINSIADGLNYAQQLEATRMQQERADIEAEVNQNLRTAQANQAQTAANVAPAQLEVNQVNALTQIQQSQLALEAARTKAAKGSDKLEQEIIGGVLDLYGQAVAAGQPIDPLQILGTMDIIRKNKESSQFVWNPKLRVFRMRNPALVLTDKDGNQTPMAVTVSPEIVKSFGYDPEAMRKHYQTEWEKTSPIDPKATTTLPQSSKKQRQEQTFKEEGKKLVKKVKEVKGEQANLPENDDEAVDVLYERLEQRAQELQRPPHNFPITKAYKQAEQELLGE